MRKTKYANIPPEDFVRRWQAAATFQDVMDNFTDNPSRSAVRSYASFLRTKKNVPLQRFTRGQGIDYEQLAKLARGRE